MCCLVHFLQSFVPLDLCVCVWQEYLAIFGDIRLMVLLTWLFYHCNIIIRDLHSQARYIRHFVEDEQEYIMPTVEHLLLLIYHWVTFFLQCVMSHLVLWVLPLENMYSVLQVLKVAILAEKYAVDYTWYVDVILNLIRIAGDYVSEEVWYRVIQIVINRDDVQGYAAKTVFEVRLYSCWIIVRSLWGIIDQVKQYLQRARWYIFFCFRVQNS